jgi:hypothetical protein
MRRLGFVLICGGILQLLTPAPAQAWFGWLDKLSGPGPFLTWDLEYRVFCVDDSRANVENVSLSNIRSEKLQRVARVLGTGCVFDTHKNPRASVNFAFGQAYATKNELQYSSTDVKKRVTMTKFEPSFSVFLNDSKTFALTTGVGALVVTGPAFDSFQRFYWKVVRGTVIPKGWNGATISVGVLYVPKGFDASDFGALPGTFHTDSEVLPTIEIAFDLARLNRARRTP